MFNPLDYLPESRKLRTVLVVILLVAIGVVTWAAVAYFGRKSYVNVRLGCQAVEGVLDSGFHYQEYEGETPFRWTNGHAKLLVPINPRQPPQTLWVQIATYRPTLDPIPFRVLVDGEPVYDDEVPQGRWEETFNLAGHEFSDEVMIELISSTFVPEGVMDEGTNDDPRQLGVQVHGVMLKRDDQ